MDELIQRELANPHSSLAGRRSEEIRAALDGDAPCDRVVDFLLRSGPYGEGFGQRADGLSLARLPELLKTPSGRIELLCDVIAGEIVRIRKELLEQPPRDSLLLIGRRVERRGGQRRGGLSLRLGIKACTAVRTMCTV